MRGPSLASVRLYHFRPASRHPPRHPGARTPVSGRPAVRDPRASLPGAGEQAAPCYLSDMEGPLLIATASLAGVTVLAAVGLATLIATMLRRLRADLTKQIADQGQRIDDYRAEAAADRRAHQAAMDTFRTEMLRLAERQSHVEGRPDGQPSAAD